ncbi:MAG TPA: dihydrodipicolinate synthase family protein [Chthoniobacterales bacterium]|jgi:4-hydroxy-tetrahydrodipicolinate synthase|nr:dihydrodipicolinate synthase family protein [Chthoniobacterales bacterium]
MIQSARIRGVVAPVLTPFKTDLSPDRERFIAHCKWLLSQNCGLAPFGTTSEGNSLAADERSMLLDALVEAGVDASRMMPGTGCCSITETVKLTAQAVKHGCAGVLMLPPFYYKGVGEEGLYRYFSEVVQRVGDAQLKIYLYHIPPVAVVGITPGLVERLLAAYPNAIAGMKDSSGDWNNTKTFLDAFAKSGFDVFVGSESFLLASMRNGGVGTISATANVNPAAIHALYVAATSGVEGPPPRDQPSRKAMASREATARLDPEGLQTKLNVVRDVFGKKFPMISALKQTIAIYANDPAWRRVRPPLVELTAEQVKKLAAELKAIGFTMGELPKALNVDT